jgi:hypothetical protein
VKSEILLDHAVPARWRRAPAPACLTRSPRTTHHAEMPRRVTWTKVRPVYSHVANDYDCPVCRGLRGEDSSAELIQASDIVDQNELAVAAVCTHFLPGSPGHVIVVPVRHYENLHAMPPRDLHACIDMAQAVALAMKARYGAAGITLRQNKRP